MKLFNTLSREKEEFVPLEAGKVKMYGCGPTVYNYFHIGNARTFLFFDLLRSYLEYKGYEVTFVQNFTDIDDKLIKKALDEDTTVAALAEKYIAAYFEDAHAIGIRDADIYPRATANIKEIVDMVTDLESKGLAYPVDGDVYYRTRSFKGYGKLSHQDIDDLESGARIAVGEQKEDPTDFALWKASKPGEPSWSSPWGEGRPGWHIECSAMSKKYLGETIDIHAGGVDLIFPHHENEIAQSEGCSGKEFARYWLHVAFLNIDNHKMSKSKNNSLMVRDIVKNCGGQAVRMFLLSGHYRTPMNFTAKSLEQARSGLERILSCASNLKFMSQNGAPGEMSDREKASVESFASYYAAFEDAMDDDLNTPSALSAVFDLVREINTTLAERGATAAYAEKSFEALNRLCSVLRIELASEDDVEPEIEALIEARQKARKERNWAEADAIRDRLKAMGIILEDTPQGVKWSRS